MKRLKRLWQFLKRLAGGTLLIWFSLVLILSLYQNRHVIGSTSSWQWFFGGLLLGGLVFCKFRMIPVYVFGHELTHWLLAKLFRRKTSSFTIRGSSGSVRVANPNIWIILGPYIFPIYVMLALVIMTVIRQFSNLPPNIWYGCMATFGSLYAYHIVLTYIALTKNQPDLAFHGVPLSLAFIIFFNVLLAYLSVMICGHAGNETWIVPWKIIKSQVAHLRFITWWNSLIL